MELIEMIRQLSEARGPSGFESAAREKAAELLRPCVDEMTVDVMGNLIARRRGASDKAPTVMLDAHIDEIGLIVTGYEKGFLRFGMLGGVDARMLPALEVCVLAEEPLFGVIGALPPHVLSAADREKPLEPDKLAIDVGLDEESVRKRVPLGTPVSFATGCLPLGAHRLSGKSLDDRSCVAILIRAMELLQGKELPCEVALVLAVQEEVGCRGAVTAAYGVAPEAAIAVDVTHGAFPDAPRHLTCELNGGPVIGVGPNMNRGISRRLSFLAERKGIPYQIEVSPAHSGTDAWPIQVSREGVATGVLSLPLRYMHTPVEVVDLRDAEACAALLAAWLEDYGTEEEENA